MYIYIYILKKIRRKENEETELIAIKNLNNNAENNKEELEIKPDDFVSNQRKKMIMQNNKCTRLNQHLLQLKAA